MAERRRGAEGGDSQQDARTLLREIETGVSTGVRLFEDTIRTRKSGDPLPFCENAILPGVDLYREDLKKWEASGAILRRANLSVTDLSGAQFRNANLSDADLQDSIAQQAFFDGASLQRAKFDRAKLQGADFTNANMAGASLNEADLSGAIFVGATWSHLDIVGATFDDETVLPNGVKFGAYIDRCIPAILSGSSKKFEDLEPRDWNPSTPEVLLLKLFDESREDGSTDVRYVDPTLARYDIPIHMIDPMTLFWKLFQARAIPYGRVLHAIELCKNPDKNHTV